MLNYSDIFEKNISSEFNVILNDLFGHEIESFHRPYLRCKSRDVAVVAGIPRFSETDEYAASFSFQWQKFPETQLDSAQGVDLTRRDLVGKLQVDPNHFKSKLVLDVGVGVGRHAEYFCESGAFVIGVDLSGSVEQAHTNLKRFPNAVVLQANLFDLPFRPSSFDLVYSVGVLHHTPSWREALAAISALPKQRTGLLSVWLYGHNFARRDEWIKLTSSIDKKVFLDLCRLLATSHRSIAARGRRLGSVSKLISTHFPFAVHHPNVTRTVLALFDGYSPAFHAVTSSKELSGATADLGYIVQPGQTEASCIGRRL